MALNHLGCSHDQVRLVVSQPATTLPTTGSEKQKEGWWEGEKGGREGGREGGWEGEKGRRGGEEVVGRIEGSM